MEQRLCVLRWAGSGKFSSCLVLAEDGRYPAFQMALPANIAVLASQAQDSTGGVDWGTLWDVTRVCGASPARESCADRPGDKTLAMLDCIIA